MLSVVDAVVRVGSNGGPALSEGLLNSSAWRWALLRVMRRGVRVRRVSRKRSVDAQARGKKFARGFFPPAAHRRFGKTVFPRYTEEPTPARGWEHRRTEIL